MLYAYTRGFGGTVNFGGEIMSCEKWLLDFLRWNLGYALVDHTRDEAKRKGYTRSKLKAARRAVGVKTYHEFYMGWDTGNRYWYLPEVGDRFE